MPDGSHSAYELQLRLGTQTFRLVPYARDCWRSVEPPGLTVRKEGRIWIASIGVGLEYLGPYSDEALTLLARARASSFQAVERLLNERVEPIRRLLGGPSAG